MSKNQLTYTERQEERRLGRSVSQYHDMVSTDLLNYPQGDMPEFLKVKIQHELQAKIKKQSVINKVKHMGNIAAIAVLFALVVSIILCITVSGIREPLLHYFMEHNGYTALDLPGGKVYVYQGSDEPYRCVGGAIGDETGTSILRNDTGDEMTVLKQHRESMKIMDTENAIVNEFVAITGEVEGQYIEKVDDDGNTVHALYWFDDEYGYQITGECPREDILRIAKGLCS